jgi:hypothetical protein
MPDWEDEPEHDGGVITETQQEVKKPLNSIICSACTIESLTIWTTERGQFTYRL